jgi:hypothetical protein
MFLTHPFPSGLTKKVLLHHSYGLNRWLGDVAGLQVGMKGWITRIIVPEDTGDHYRFCKARFLACCWGSLGFVMLSAKDKISDADTAPDNTGGSTGKTAENAGF